MRVEIDFLHVNFSFHPRKIQLSSANCQLKTANCQLKIANWLLLLFLVSCSPARVLTGEVPKQAETKEKGRDIKEGDLVTDLLAQEPFRDAHVGISIYDVAAQKYVYDYQGNKYFVPASNTKIFTLYTGLKYLKDSLEGMRYRENADTFFVYPTGDPTLLHPDFKRQPVIQKLQATKKKVVLVNQGWQEFALGSGWSWDDYNDQYMVERSAFPVYGNMIKWVQVSQKNTQPELEDSMQTFVFSEPEVNWKVRFKEDTLNRLFHVQRRMAENYFEVSQGREGHKEQLVPFVTNGLQSATELLKDTVSKEVGIVESDYNPAVLTLYSQPADSLYKIMMYRSDNFFAEQVLLMASFRKFGIMNERTMIDSMLNGVLSGLPQKPTWVDGSGLSRYNQFSPQDFIWILNKLLAEFGLERLKHIFPGSGNGTLTNYYTKESGYIFAKTGTLAGQVALSGYLITRKGKTLTFSVLVNNHAGSAADVRHGVEQFLGEIRNKY